MASPVELPRTRLSADPEGKFVHDAILESCHRNASKLAIVDASSVPPRRITYAAYGEMVEMAAQGMVAADIMPARQSRHLPAQLLGVRRRLSRGDAGRSGANHAEPYVSRTRSPLSTGDVGSSCADQDGSLLTGIESGGLPALRKVYTDSHARP